MEGNISQLKELHAYRERISNILESFTDGFFEVDTSWTVTYWNGVAENLLMMPRQEILGKNLWAVYQDAIPLKFYTAYHQAVEQKVAVRFEEYFPAKKMWFEVAAFPSGNGLSVYFKDITSKKHAMQQLELERQKYRDLFNKSPFPQWVYDIETLRFLDVNEAAVVQYGYTKAEFLALSLLDIRPPEDHALLEKILNSEVQTGVSNKAIVRHIKKNGELIDVTVEGNSVDFEGRTARMVTVVDRTAELMAQKDIERSMARFDIVSKATSDAIWDWDMSTGEIIWNQGIRGIFGYSQIVFDQAWRSSRIHPEDSARVEEVLKRTIATAEKKITIEYRFLCADGSYRTVLDRAFIIFDEKGSAQRMIGSMQDISERMNHLEKIEKQNAKLKEISWIQAHKVRAPLSNVMGLVNLFTAVELKKEEMQKVIQMIGDNANALDTVIREITAKSKA